VSSTAASRPVAGAYGWHYDLFEHYEAHCPTSSSGGTSSGKIARSWSALVSAGASWRASGL